MQAGWENVQNMRSQCRRFSEHLQAVQKMRSQFRKCVENLWQDRRCVENLPHYWKCVTSAEKSSTCSRWSSTLLAETFIIQYNTADKELTHVPVVKDLLISTHASVTTNISLRPFRIVFLNWNILTEFFLQSNRIFFPGTFFSAKAREMSVGTRLKYAHILDGLRSLNWLPIKKRLILNDVTMVHKCINKFVPDYLADMFKLRSHVHNTQTRSSSALDITSPVNEEALFFLQRSKTLKLWITILSSLNAPRILGYILQNFY